MTAGRDREVDRLEAVLAEYLRRLDNGEPTKGLLSEEPKLEALLGSGIFDMLRPVQIPAAAPKQRQRARTLMMARLDILRSTFIMRMFGHKFRLFGISALVITAGLGASVASGAVGGPAPHATIFDTLSIDSIVDSLDSTAHADDSSRSFEASVDATPYATTSPDASSRDEERSASQDEATPEATEPTPESRPASQWSSSGPAGVSPSAKTQPAGEPDAGREAVPSTTPPVETPDQATPAAGESGTQDQDAPLPGQAELPQPADPGKGPAGRPAGQGDTPPGHGTMPPTQRPTNKPDGNGPPETPPGQDGTPPGRSQGNGAENPAVGGHGNNNVEQDGGNGIGKDGAGSVNGNEAGNENGGRGGENGAMANGGPGVIGNGSGGPNDDEGSE